MLPQLTLLALCVCACVCHSLSGPRYQHGPLLFHPALPSQILNKSSFKVTATRTRLILSVVSVCARACECVRARVCVENHMTLVFLCLYE